MQIHGPSHVHGPQPINAPHRAQPAEAAEANYSMMGADQLEISREAELISRIHDLPDIRADRVAELRAAIAEGTYETEEKLEMAIERLLETEFRS